MIRRSVEEKREIIHIVEHSEMSVTQTLKELDVPRSSFSRRTPGRCIAGSGITWKKAKKA
jgi:hypothetical protein